MDRETWFGVWGQRLVAGVREEIAGCINDKEAQFSLPANEKALLNKYKQSDHKKQWLKQAKETSS